MTHTYNLRSTKLFMKEEKEVHQKKEVQKQEVKKPKKQLNIIFYLFNLFIAICEILTPSKYKFLLK
jgi:hypothetical protein